MHLHQIQPAATQSQSWRAIAQTVLLALAVPLVMTPAALAEDASKPATAAAEKPKALAFNAGPAALQAPTLNSAIETFNKRDFHAALQDFEKLSAKGVKPDLVHYYMAQCYQQTAQVGAALENYKLVVATTKDPTLRYYSITAYQQLSKYSKHRTYDGQGNVFVQNKGRHGGHVHSHHH